MGRQRFDQAHPADRPDRGHGRRREHGRGLEPGRGLSGPLDRPNPRCRRQPGRLRDARAGSPRPDRKPDVSGFGLNLQKAGLRVVAGDARTSNLTFTYNPTEMSTSKTASWNRPTTNAANDATQPQFAGVQPQSVQMEIFFDAYEDL